MDEPRQVLAGGTEVITHDVLGTTTGMLIKRDLLAKRRGSAKGVIISYVPGHGGDVYWVRHGDEDVTAYMWTEFDLVNPPEEEPDLLNVAIEAFQSILEAENPKDMVTTAGFALAQLGGELPEGADDLGRGAYGRGQDA